VKTLRAILAIAAGLSCFPEALGQPVDKWFWPAAQFEAEFFDRLELSLNLEARVNENYSNLRSFFGEVEGKWKFNKYLTSGLAYRLGGRESDLTDYAKGQRITLIVYGKVDVSKFTITNKAGVFRQFLENAETPLDYFREKLTLRFNMTKKLRPLAYGEFFYRLDSEPKKIDEWRLGGGVDFDITKRHGIKALFIYTEQVNVKKPDVRHVWALTYTYKLKFNGKATEEN
jgi:hypothetical protein